MLTTYIFFSVLVVVCGLAIFTLGEMDWGQTHITLLIVIYLIWRHHTQDLKSPFSICFKNIYSLHCYLPENPHSPGYPCPAPRASLTLPRAQNPTSVPWIHQPLPSDTTAGPVSGLPQPCLARTWALPSWAHPQAYDPSQSPGRLLVVRVGVALGPQLAWSGLEVGWAGTARPCPDAFRGETPSSIPQRWLV